MGHRSTHRYPHTTMREALEHIVEARKDNKARKGGYEADIHAGRPPHRHPDPPPRMRHRLDPLNRTPATA